MGRQKWTDERFGQRIRAEREARDLSQADVARKLSAAGVRPMYPTTVSKIETAERSVRINEAVGLADLFGMSLDNLVGRPDDSTVAFALTTLCRYAGDAQRQIKRAQETAADIGDQLESVEESFDLGGVDDLRQVAEDMGAALQAAQSTARILVALVSGAIVEAGDR
jgi:transcriptional regulator with XRE-family HTH domain